MKNKNSKKTNQKESNLTLMEGIVAAVMNKQVTVHTQDGVISCLIPGSLTQEKNALVVGDRVELGSNGHGQNKLLCTLPRKNTLYRGNRRSPGEELAIAANVQLLLAVVTAEYLLHQSGYLEAAAIAARRADMEFGIWISKWDLIGEEAKALLQSRLALYRPSAKFVIAGCTQDQHLAEGLRETVKGKTVVVVGDRSCGKTSLIRAVLSEQPEGSRIPSTHTSVLQAGPDGTVWIDSPGFRDFALNQISEEERNAAFPEIAQLGGNCSFHNCSHVHEEGCQVKKALLAKQITRERYDAYQKMIPAVSGAAPKEDYRRRACTESFVCKACGTLVVPEGAGSQHRNHCPKCLSSVHVDEEPGDRACLCHGIMEPISVWVRKGGEWAVIQRCRSCGTLSSNRIAADDNPALLLSIAVKPLAMTPFPLDKLEDLWTAK